jgi:hypothetical protein
MTSVISAPWSAGVFKVKTVTFHDTTGGCVMATPPSSDQRPPLGQRLLDHPFLLLLAGLAVMSGFYTLWGLYEILSLPRATLP